MNRHQLNTDSEQPLVAKQSRPATDGEGRYPDFVIIGAGRSGTTTLQSVLSHHPKIFMCDPKEPFFFSHESERARGEVWYRGLFARSRKDQICGEASTSYSCWPECGDVAGLIAEAIPQAKLIYIVRHPVDRAYSHYDYDRIRLGLRMTFEEALERDVRFINTSLYLVQIKQYLRYFDRSSMLVVFFDDLLANPEETLARIWAFLGVPKPVPPLRPLVVNSGDEHYVRTHTTVRLRSLPGVSWLADRLPRSWRETAFRLFSKSSAYRSIAKDHRLPPMRPETRLRLLEVFEEPNRELAEFLNRDLSAWSK